VSDVRVAIENVNIGLMNAHDTFFASLDGGQDIDDAAVLHQSGVIGVQMVTQPATVDEFSQFFCVSDEFFRTQD